MEGFPLKGGLVIDPELQMCYWLPAIPATSNQGLLRQKGYQPFPYDEALLIRLLTTFASVRQLVYPDTGQIQFWALPDDLIFATQVQVALGLPPPNESRPTNTSSLLTTADYPPREIGLRAMRLVPGQRFQPLNLELLDGKQRLAQIRIQQILERLEQLNPWDDEYADFQKYLHTYAQRLAKAYESVSPQEKAIEPPIVAAISLFAQGIAFGVTPLPLEAIILAIQDWASGGNHWTITDTPFYQYTSPQGQVKVMVQLPPLPPPESTLSPAFWQEATDLLPSFQDMDADIALLLILLYVNVDKSPEGFIWVSPEVFLRLRGIKGTSQQSGYRTEQRQNIVESMERLTCLQVVGNQRVRGKRIEFETCNFIHVQRRYYASSLEGNHTRILAFQVKPGMWFDPWLAIGEAGRQIDVYVQQVFAFNASKKIWEKRIARWLFFRLRIAAGEGSLSIRLPVGELLDQCALTINPDHPDASRQRFEQALRILVEQDIISGCIYRSSPPVPASKRKKESPRIVYPTTPPVQGYHFNTLQPHRVHRWIEEWQEWEIEISMGSLFLQNGYLDKSKQVLARKKIGNDAEEADSNATDLPPEEY